MWPYDGQFLLLPPASGGGGNTGGLWVWGRGVEGRRWAGASPPPRARAGASGLEGRRALRPRGRRTPGTGTTAEAPGLRAQRWTVEGRGPCGGGAGARRGPSCSRLPPAFHNRPSRGLRPRAPLRLDPPPPAAPVQTMLHYATLCCGPLRPGGAGDRAAGADAQCHLFCLSALRPSYSLAPRVVVGAAARSSRVKPRACMAVQRGAMHSKRRAALVNSRRHVDTPAPGALALMPGGLLVTGPPGVLHASASGSRDR